MPHQSWKIPASLLAQNQEHPGRNQWIPQLIYTKVRCGSKTWDGVSFPCGPSFSKKSKNQKQKANDYEAKKSKWSRQLRLCRRIESVGFTYRRKNRVVMISSCTPRVEVITLVGFGWFRHVRVHMLSRLLTYTIGSRTRSLAHFNFPPFLKTPRLISCLCTVVIFNDVEFGLINTPTMIMMG